MSQSVRLLSEAESAAAAEVSVETIRKYRDCGLLDPVLKDNQTYFQEVDIQTLFFTKFKPKNGQPSTATAAKPDYSSRPASAASPQQATVTPPAAVTAAAATPEQPPQVMAPVVAPVEAPPAASMIASPEPVAAPFQPALAPQEAAKPTAETEAVDLQPMTGQASPDAIEIHRSEPAVQLPSSVELIELNKNLRDQIQMVREERDWLRDRIEKLESRSEREQMLLLSESENVRKLITSTQKSFWQRALPWIGDKK